MCKNFLNTFILVLPALWIQCCDPQQTDHFVHSQLFDINSDLQKISLAHVNVNAALDPAFAFPRGNANAGSLVHSLNECVKFAFIHRPIANGKFR